MKINLQRVLHCQDCGAENTELIQLESKRVVCSDRVSCAFAQAVGDSNA